MLVLMQFGCGSIEPEPRLDANGTPIPANYWDSLPHGAHFGDSPLGGAHTFLTASLHLLADFTPSGTVRAKALQYGTMLLGSYSDNDLWNKWIYCTPGNYVGQ